MRSTRTLSATRPPSSPFRCAALVPPPPCACRRRTHRWDRAQISPMAVVISEETVPLYHFLTNICAIIGGLFTVFSMATGMLDATIKTVRLGAFSICAHACRQPE